MLSTLRRAIVGLLAGAAMSLAAVPALAQASKATVQAQEYRLGAGDVIRITVYQNPDLTLEARVSEAGTISYPLLGSLRLGGMTVGQAERVIADGLRSGNFIRQPQVSVLVMQVRGNQVSVLGYVNRPGRFPIEVADMHLTDLLAMAGGISSAGADVLVLVGTRDGKPFRKEVALPTIFANDRSDDILVANGDVVYVDRAPVIYIYGEVQRPGALRLEPGMTLLQALAAGGGLTQRGTERGLRVHRAGAQGKVQVLQPAMDDRLQSGDVVYVKESLF